MNGVSQSKAQTLKIFASERVLVRVVLDIDFRTQHLPQERDELQQS